MEVADIARGGEAFAGVESHDPDFDAEFFANLSRVITETEKTVAAGDSKFDGGDRVVAKAFGLACGVIEAPGVVRPGHGSGAEAHLPGADGETPQEAAKKEGAQRYRARREVNESISQAHVPSGE